jgi:hypothetical protein
MVAASAPFEGSWVVKLALKLAGALAMLGGLALLIAGGVVYARLLAGGDADALFDSLDPIAIGAFGALFGVGLIVYATRASQRGQL